MFEQLPQAVVLFVRIQNNLTLQIQSKVNKMWKSVSLLRLRKLSLHLI